MKGSDGLVWPREELHTAASDLTKQGAIRQIIKMELLRLLLNARQLTGEEYDPAFDRVTFALASWPRRFAYAIIDEMDRQFIEARKKLTEAMESKPLPSFRNAWSKFRKEVMVPLQEDLDTLIAEMEFLRPVDSAREP